MSIIQAPVVETSKPVRYAGKPVNQEMLDRSTLGESDRAAIEVLVKKAPTALTDTDKASLRARRAYLTPVEKNAFAEVLDEEPADAVEEGDGLEKMTVAELKALCDEKEIEVTEGSRKADLVALLRADAEAKA